MDKVTRTKMKLRRKEDRLAGPLEKAKAKAAGYLESGWVIANHKLVSFHAAFISSVLSVPADVENKFQTLRFMFVSWETIVSLAIWYLSWHIGIAIHEMGHFLEAVKLTALNKDSQEKAQAVMKGGGGKFGWYAKMFLLIPWGKFYGVKKEGGNFAPDAPYNLAVAAVAPIWSGYRNRHRRRAGRKYRHPHLHRPVLLSSGLRGPVRQADGGPRQAQRVPKKRETRRRTGGQGS